jgi:Transcriptional regulators
MLLMKKLMSREDFTDTEQKIVQYVLKNPYKVKQMTIIDLADETYTSTAAIVRLCKKLNLSGFTAFKMNLATESNAFIMQDDIDMRIEQEMPFTPEASDDEIVNALLKLHHQALADAQNNFELETMQEIAEVIYNADEIVLFGTGMSLIIAETFHYNLMRIGIHSTLNTVEGFQVLNARSTDFKRKRVALIVSHYVRGNNIEVLFDELEYAKTPIILLCGNDRSPWAKKADYVINAQSEETKSKMSSFSSRTTMLFFLDVLYSLIFNFDYSKSQKFIEDSMQRDMQRELKHNMKKSDY